MAILYSEVRNTLKTGDLLSWKAGKIKSVFDIILFFYQKILKTKSVHTGIVVKIGDRIFVAEARPPSVRLYPLSKMGDFYLLKLDLKDDNDDYNKILREMGVPYGYIDLLKGILGFKNSSKELYCSELCAKFYVEKGFFPSYIYKEAARVPDSLINVAESVSKKKFEFVHIDRENLTEV